MMKNKKTAENLKTSAQNIEILFTFVIVNGLGICIIFWVILCISWTFGYAIEMVFFKNWSYSGVGKRLMELKTYYLAGASMIIYLIRK